MHGQWVALGVGCLLVSACNCGQRASKTVPDPVVFVCAGDGDCTGGQVCVAGTCQEPGGGGADAGLCQSDGDCPDLRFVCVPATGACLRDPNRCLSDGDCPGGVRCDLATSTCLACADGALRRCGSSAVGECRFGTQVCSGGAWTACRGAVEPAAETCDGADNDCNGVVDDGFDLLGDPANCGRCQLRCQFPNAMAFCSLGRCEPGPCLWGWTDANGLPGDGCEYRCTPTAGGVEVCDGVDNDCDGHTDEGLASVSCGEGQCRRTVEGCAGGAVPVCLPGAPVAEVCDGVDNDCDGRTDEELAAVSCGEGRCRRIVEGCLGGVVPVCLPGAPATEICDGVDNDCDGRTDEGLASVSCGEGQCRRTVESCLSGNAQVCQPGAPATEVCDGADDDCDGLTDENVTVYTQDGDSQRVDPIIRPMDIVFVVANNGTMNEEIAAVEANINQNFASLMDRSGIDYRVIVISKYGHGGSTGNWALCVRPPLGGNETCTGTCPVNTGRFFHYSADVGAHDSLERVVSTYAAPDECGLAPGGWSQWLRPDAAKVFIEITDNGPTTGNPDQDNGIGADAFEARLFGLGPAFGSAAARDYRFHAIVGLAENDPAAAAWLPGSPLVDARCTGNGGYVQQPGLEYQKLSVRTGGLRYPICQYQSFDAIFAEVARGIVLESEISCDFAISSVPSDSGMDQTLLEMVGSAGDRRELAHVAGREACQGEAFYTEGTTIRLCPDACTLWRADPEAKAEVTFTCRVP